MPFDDEELVSVIVDGEVGWRGKWSQAKNSLSQIVERIEMNHRKEHFRGTGLPKAEMERLAKMPVSIDSFCVTAEGKERELLRKS